MTSRGPWHKEVLFGRLAIVAIEIPLASGRLVTIHQQSGSPAHIAIEILHAKLLAAFGQLAKRRGTENRLSGKDFDRDAGRIAPIVDHLANPPLGGFGYEDPVRLMRFHRSWSAAPRDLKPLAWSSA